MIGLVMVESQGGVFIWSVALGKGQILVTVLLVSPFGVHKVTTLTSPSVPGWISTTRPMDHLVGGIRSSCIRTKSSTARFARRCRQV
ncbi:coenzyme f420-dependent -methylene tetrahydromethanopterin reductase [Lasius niger]|uniref:Coenzyme f420-dependent-methylene tetrahydromethanopterin reductase n=1 Tax=Lasius niger TaxID=67767 RepID=A0A0J7K9P8_LASNI|nr:coenzyme f420-dependent -methylene tetrahydromethanopterin reductase [Lasius niger]